VGVGVRVRGGTFGRRFCKWANTRSGGSVPNSSYCIIISQWGGWMWHCWFQQRQWRLTSPWQAAGRISLAYDYTYTIVHASCVHDDPWSSDRRSHIFFLP
jgi:hypothetical protein